MRSVQISQKVKTIWSISVNTLPIAFHLFSTANEFHNNGIVIYESEIIYRSQLNYNLIQSENCNFIGHLSFQFQIFRLFFQKNLASSHGYLPHFLLDLQISSQLTKKKNNLDNYELLRESIYLYVKTLLKLVVSGITFNRRQANKREEEL